LASHGQGIASLYRDERHGKWWVAKVPELQNAAN